MLKKVRGLRQLRRSSKSQDIAAAGGSRALSSFGNRKVCFAYSRDLWQVSHGKQCDPDNLRAVCGIVCKKNFEVGADCSGKGIPAKSVERSGVLLPCPGFDLPGGGTLQRIRSVKLLGRAPLT
jgi:hypothetical protein